MTLMIDKIIDILFWPAFLIWVGYIVVSLAKLGSDWAKWFEIDDE